MISLLFIIIPLLSQYQVLSSPVLLWSNANLPESLVSFSTVSPISIISDYICKIENENVQIRLFTVNGLTNEGIQAVLQSKHQVLVDAKNEKSQYRYFPNVADDAHTAFSLIDRSNNMKCSRKHFSIAEEGIYHKLEDALDEMQHIIKGDTLDPNTVTVMVLIDDPVAHERMNRQRRDLEASAHDVLVSDDQSCMFYADKLYWSDVNGQGTSVGNFTLDLQKSSCEPKQTVTPSGNITSVILNLFWTNGTNDIGPMTLMANITGRYWYLEEATLDGTEYRYFAYGMHSQMDTPPSYSYVCKTAVFVKYNATAKYGLYDFKNKFFLTNLQFQPFNANGSYFGQPNYCTSFFTSGIWMGLTSSLLCLGILLFGIYRMMSIKSNDRFDDPKGKPLIIKAQE